MKIIKSQLYRNQSGYSCSGHKSGQALYVAQWEQPQQCLVQFITLIGENSLDKETLNSYLQYIHSMYKQKTVKRKIASVKALFHYLEEEEIVEINPFHKVKTKFKEEDMLFALIGEFSMNNLGLKNALF